MKNTKPKNKNHKSTFKAEIQNIDSVEKLLKELMGKITEAAYRLAKKLGFAGSFIHYLNELEISLQKIIHNNHIGRSSRVFRTKSYKKH